jgi:hypothetical protein
MRPVQGPKLESLSRHLNAVQTKARTYNHTRNLKAHLHLLFSKYDQPEKREDWREMRETQMRKDVVK